MKPDTAPQGESPGPVRVRFQVQFSRGPRGQRGGRHANPASTGPDPVTTRAEVNMGPSPKPATALTVPKITRMLVLGYHFERLVREEKVKNYAGIARLTGLSRARVTQVVDLTLLSPGVQEGILCRPLDVPGELPADERTSRSPSRVKLWRT